jgi:hypothetical protein
MNCTNYLPDEDPDMVNRRDSVATRLLLACRQTLSERGMVGMFVDGSRHDENVLQSLGKEKTRSPCLHFLTLSFSRIQQMGRV